MCRLFNDIVNESLRKENAELERQLTEYRQRDFLREMFAPYCQSLQQQSVGMRRPMFREKVRPKE